MSDVPAILANLPIHWTGVDDSTPTGCTLFCTTVVGIPTTYILRDGQVIGRIEGNGTSLNGYTGSGLKGGGYAGSGVFYELAERIATHADN